MKKSSRILFYRLLNTQKQKIFILKMKKFLNKLFTETDASYDACTGLILKQCHLKRSPCKRQD